MKILVLADGRSIHTDRYIAELKSLGVEVTLASLEEGKNVDIILKRRTGIASLDYFLSAKEIRRLARKYSPDIINPHFASGYGFATAVSGVWRKCPVILHCLGSDILLSPNKSPLHRARVKYALYRSTQIMADSEYLKKKTLEINGESSIEVVPWGVEVALMQIFDSKIKTVNLRRRPLKILVPRPHQQIYNNTLILSALREFLLSREVIITFPARGDDYEKFRKATKSEIASGAINFYKYLDRNEYIEFMSGFDVYLSATFFDSSPASLLEAMAAGLFPVVCDFPGVREWVDEKTALLFDPENQESLHDAIEQLLRMPADVNNILMHNNRVIKEKALFSDNIKKTVNIMERLVKDAGR